MAETTPRFSAAPLPSGSRVALCVEYDGSAYSGWQAQSGAPSVQESLEAALAAIANCPVRVQCAGRTDAGVHALAQWVHFDDPLGRSPKAWVLGTNAHLPPAVRVRHAQAVDPEFHARFSARSRSYRYLIANTPVAPALFREQLTWRRGQLDASLMHAAAQQLLGEQDFSAFRAASCQSRTAMRCVSAIGVFRSGSLVVLEVTANAFLHHMVRNIAGALMVIGRGERDGEWLRALLASRDRTRGAATAPAAGLYLVDVEYADHFGVTFSPAPLPAFFLSH